MEGFVDNLKVQPRRIDPEQVIADYCDGQGFSGADSFAVLWYHRQQPLRRLGIESSPERTLERIASEPKFRAQLYASASRCGAFRYFSALVEMAERPRYAGRIRRVYETEVKPLLE